MIEYAVCILSVAKQRAPPAAASRVPKPVFGLLHARRGRYQDMGLISPSFLPLPASLQCSNGVL